MGVVVVGCICMVQFFVHKFFLLPLPAIVTNGCIL
jgi:hypothetical protein